MEALSNAFEMHGGRIGLYGFQDQSYCMALFPILLSIFKNCISVFNDYIDCSLNSSIKKSRHEYKA